MTTEQYIRNLNERYLLGNSTEHTYRGDLQQLLESLIPEVRATNEPKRQSCGAPDYILTRKDIPVGFIEAKDVGDSDLDGTKKSGNKEQFDRYKASLTNLIFTDYINFHLYQDGEFVSKISIAKLSPTGITPLRYNFKQFENLIKDFCSHIGQTIKSPEKLAKMMAGKARLLSDVIERTLNLDIKDELNPDTALQEQYETFKTFLIHDITPKGFSDVYAQTITYGMFAARLHDPTLNNFSRQEAADLIPKSNPFLRKLFQFIAGYDLDQNLIWIVDNLVEIFLSSNVQEILKNYGKSTKMEDPIIHFYETFLSEYDPKLRKSRGVWYTPTPVVNFIVRAVDDLLKSEFQIEQGLADTSKTKIKIKTDIPNKKFKSGYREVEKEVHKVQILDPATGTGTFLAEVIKLIHKEFAGMQGIWSKYVEDHLLPRINGFEILMASYAMAHLKLDLLLNETGFKPTTNQRFRVYLTNSLEESHPDTGTLFANWLSSEANEANYIKRDTPVMCVIGNPPYSGISSNKGEWINNLIEDYKYVDGEHFKERKHWLNDDYVKFLRYGQHHIEKNGSGILAYINPHGFLDNPTFRGMRWNLLKTYDKLFIIDLHGNSKKKETAPDGSKDVNVFDIQQGVSINIFVKSGKKKANQLGKVFHYDLYGKRQEKYDFLSNQNLSDIDFVIPNYQKPFYFLKPFDYEVYKEYQEGFKVTDVFSKNSVGCVSANDRLNISYSSKEQLEKVQDLLDMEESQWRNSYDRLKDARDWTYKTAKEDAQGNHSKDIIKKINYRPFDFRWTAYTGNSRGLYSSPQSKTMSHFIKGENLGLVIGRQGQVVGNMPWNLISITENITDFNLFYRGGGMLFPLYLYGNSTSLSAVNSLSTRIPNLNKNIIDKFSNNLGLSFVNEVSKSKDSFSPIDILDFIYAILHSPRYRKIYGEFLKTDFPIIPYPKNKQNFWKITNLGQELRKTHLLDFNLSGNRLANYPKVGDNIITAKLTKSSPGYVETTTSSGKVFVNDEQYFDNVPLVAWEFYVGGYQPAQKWLKDRKGRKLDFTDILHYQKIIVALTQTDEIMKKIDAIEF